MNIDHASREPDDPPAPTPTAVAFEALFVKPGGPASKPAYDLRPLTWAAVVRHGGQRTGAFTIQSFAGVVVDKFDLRRPPTDAWCRKVLRGLDYVTEYPDGKTYRVQTG